MFTELKKEIRAILCDECMTYLQLSEKAGVSEGTIKNFMCGISNSPRVAACIADALDRDLVYSRGTYFFDMGRTFSEGGENSPKRKQS